MRVVVVAVALVVACGSHGGNHSNDAPNRPRDAAADSAVPVDASPDAPPILASQCAQLGTYGFAGSAIDWGCWDDSFTRDGLITQSDALVLQPQGSGTYSAAQLATSYAFTGDFDVSVSYALAADWAGDITTMNAHMDVTLEAFAESSQHVVVARSKNSGGIEQVFGYSFGPQSGSQFVARPYTGLTGKLRLTRTGTSLLVRVDNGSGWITITTFTFTAAPTHIVVTAASVGIARAFTATLDDFTITAGATDFVPYVDRPTQARTDLRLGTVPCDYLAKREWDTKWVANHPFDALSQNGLSWVRVGLTTVSSSLLASTPRSMWRSLGWHDEFWSSLEYVGAILDDAAARNMHLEVFLLLSNTAAHAGLQNAPPEWANLSVADTATAIEAYANQTATYFANRGLDVEVYDLGNEIDSGVVGFTPGGRVAVPAGTDIICDVKWMHDNIWVTEAQLLNAAARGIRRANPSAKIVLHTTGMFGLCLGIEGPAFFDTMIEQNVDFDYAGLSFYPGLLPAGGKWGAGPWLQRAQALVAHIATLGKKTIIAETAYPHATVDPTAWGTAVPEWSYAPDGQRAWLDAMMRFTSNNPNIVGWMYFYPEYYPGFTTGATSGSYGLFETETQPEPALLDVPH